MRRFLKQFSMFDLAVISMTAAMGIGIKPIIVPLVHIVTGPLYIPGGAAAGGFYMLWIVLGIGMTRKMGTGTLIGLIQGLVVIITGVYGTHGAVSIVTYTLPGIITDIGAFLLGSKLISPAGFFTLGLMANISGTLLSSMVFFRLPLIPLLLSLSAAALSGGLGGLIAYRIERELIRMGVINHMGKRGDMDEE